MQSTKTLQVSRVHFLRQSLSQALLQKWSNSSRTSKFCSSFARLASLWRTRI